MDQIQIGKFISECRRAKDMTQRELADRLLISDKTVSKWECGKGLPEVSLMLPLCETLEISVNELLSGQRLDEQHYKEKAEENMMNLIKEKEENRRKVILSALTCIMTLLASLTIILLAGLLDMPDALRVVLLVIGLVIMVMGLGVAAALEWNAGYYECRHCGERFIPTMGAYLKGAHTLTTRRLKCPACGQKSYCRRRLSKG